MLHRITTFIIPGIEILLAFTALILLWFVKIEHTRVVYKFLHLLFEKRINCYEVSL